jgi:hypothetical protein
MLKQACDWTANEDVSSQLLADWVPSLSPAVGSSFMGWPPLLLEEKPLKGLDVLTLRAETGRTERQWKGVLSWMLGVAGARHTPKRTLRKFPLAQSVSSRNGGNLHLHKRSQVPDQCQFRQRLAYRHRRR